MNLLPILRRDLRAETRGRRWTRERWMIAVVGAVSLAGLLVVERWVGGFSLSSWMRTIPISFLAPLALIVHAVGRGANLVAFERREGTLPLLLLTRLTGHDIVRGKLLQAMLIEVALVLALAPVLVLPLTMAGFSWRALFLLGLGCLNVLFVGLSLGLLASVFLDGPIAGTCAMLLLTPWLIFSTPLAFLIPYGALREFLTMIQWCNPCEPLAHLPMVVAGIRTHAYWLALLASHITGWVLLTAAGALLPVATRRLVARQRRPAFSRRVRAGAPWPAWRTLLLDRNPYLWLCARHRWPTVQIWLLLVSSTLLWGWLIWLAVLVKGVNVTLVMVIGAAVSWGLALLVTSTSEASRRLIDDRNSGGFELLLCTPLTTRLVILGQWLTLSRRYLVPLLLTLVVSGGLTVAGYVTFGFGGMLDPDDRGQWLAAWLGGIAWLPCVLVGTCAVAMRRALVARDTGEASAVALFQVIGLPVFAVWLCYWVAVWIGADVDGWWIVLGLAAAFLGTPLVWAWRAQKFLLTQLRQAAANRY